MLYKRHKTAKPTYAQNILQALNQYGPMDITMTLLKTLSKASLLTHYENFFKLSHHGEWKLIY